MAAESEQLVEHLLAYIHQHYPYDLRGDLQLRADLQTHISAMLLRVKYQIGSHNPLADHIKQYYPSPTTSRWRLSRSGSGRLLSADPPRDRLSGDPHRGRAGAPLRHRLHPPPPGAAAVRCRQRHLSGAGGPHQAGVSPVAADHAGVGAGLRRAGADRAGLRHQHRQGRREERARGAGRPFPTQYQLEQLGKLVLVDRTRPYLLDKYFDADHFMVATEPLSQAALFDRICSQLEAEDLVESGFRGSLQERERIVSTMLGTASLCPTPSACWRAAPWSIPCWPRRGSTGATARAPPSSSCWPSPRPTTKRPWGSTTCSWR